MRWEWDFGNGNTSVLANPTLIYTNPGEYIIKLKVYDANLNWDTVSQIFKVFSNPKADFTLATKGTICINNDVSFKDASIKGSGTINKWEWDFANAKSSKTQHPTNSYETPGKFAITLVVTDNNGCTNFKSIKDFVNVSDGPKASFDAVNTESCQAPHNVIFNPTVKDGTAPYNYSWDFGDGNASALEKPNQIYQKFGNYTISLTVTDALGCKAFAKQANYVKINPLSVDFDVIGNPKVCQNKPFQFLNTSFPKFSGATYFWEFGDENISYDMAPLHKYNSDGLYSVKLTVKFANCKETIEKEQFIQILQPPSGKIYIKDTVFCAAGSGTFKIDSTAFRNYEWIIADRKYSGIQGSFFITGMGTFNSSVKVTNALGCTAVLTGPKIVYESPTIKIGDELNKQNCIPSIKSFEDKSTSKLPIIKYVWQYGKLPADSGKIPTFENTRFVMVDTGLIKLKYKIVNSNNCVAEQTFDLYAGMKFKPKSFSLQPNYICPGEATKITDSTPSYGVNNIVKRWQLGSYVADSDVDLVKSIVGSNSGWNKATLNYTHNGCLETLTLNKMVFVKEFFPKLQLLDSIICDYLPTVTLFATLKNVMRYKIIYPDLSETFNEVKPYKLKEGSNKFSMIAHNDTMNCSAETGLSIEVPYKLYPKSKYNQYQKCLPRAIACTIDDSSFFATKKIEWYLNGKLVNTEFLDKKGYLNNTYNYKINDTGKFILSQISYNTFNCPYASNDSIVIVTESKTAPGLISLNKCTAIKIELTDSFFTNTDKSIRFWVSGIDTFWQTNKTIQIEPKNLEVRNGYYYLQFHKLQPNTCDIVQSFLLEDYGIVPSIILRKSPDCHYPFVVANFRGSGILQNSIRWYYDDQITNAGDITAIEKFKTPGIHYVRFEATTIDGCKYKVTEKIFIDTPKTYTNFTVDKTVGTCPPFLVKYTNKSFPIPEAINTYFWDFGDGSTSDKEHPEKTYVYPGFYRVKLIIKDQNDCKDEAIKENLIEVKGPIGTFNFPRSRACVPVEVNFELKKLDANFFKWDLGDGVTDSINRNPIKSYSRPGKYIPVVILSDTSGCQYVMPSIDTIFAYDYPKTAITTDFICFGNQTMLKDTTVISDGQTLKYEWTLNNQQKSNEKNPLYKPVLSGKQTIKLIVNTENGCADSASKEIKVPLLKAIHQKYKMNACVGDTLQFFGNAKSEAGVKKYEWQILNKHYEQKNIIVKLDTIGRFDYQLVVIDNLGCTDTLKQTDKLLIGDRKPAEKPMFYYASVADDYTIDIKYSRAKNPDFFKYTIYNPNTNPMQLWGTFYNYNDTLVSKNNLNTLSNVYCFKVGNMNACELEQPLDSLITHCTIDIKGKAIENAALVNWNSYTGWKVDKYEIYRDEFKNEKGFIKIGEVNGDILNYTDTNIFCKMTFIYKVKAKELIGNSESSWSDTCHVRPIWTLLPSLAENWRATVENNQFTRLEWLKSNVTITPIKSYEITRNNQFINLFNLESGVDNQLFFEDFKTKVNDVSYQYFVQAKDTCDMVSPKSNVAKTILLKTTFDVVSHRPLLSWTAYKEWKEGIEHYTVERQNAEGIFEQIGQTKDTLFLDQRVPLTCMPEYTYRVTAFRNQPVDSRRWNVQSISNHATVKPTSTLFIPNAFTPDNNGINEVFAPKGTFISNYKLMIYNRWGEKLFETTDCLAGWDGKYLGSDCMQGVYMYIIYALGADDRAYFLKGDFTLLK